MKECITCGGRYTVENPYTCDECRNRAGDEKYGGGLGAVLADPETGDVIGDFDPDFDAGDGGDGR